MGHNSKKKKKVGGGSRRSKGRTPSKDHHAARSEVENELLSEEITALCAIFQDDCEVVREFLPQIIIKLRPYSKDTGYENLDISAVLLVRCLPGYPYKCPKLQITPEKGLLKSDAEKLLSLLQDQANANARAGRVMIYNLVEAAQEFLSEIITAGQFQESVTSSSIQVLHDDGETCKRNCSVMHPFVYGFIDLFSGCGESWHWDVEVVNNGESSIAHTHKVNCSELECKVQRHNLDQTTKLSSLHDSKQGLMHLPAAKQDIIEQDSDNDSRSIPIMDSAILQMDDLALDSVSVRRQGRRMAEHTVDDNDDEPENNSHTLSFTTSMEDVQASQTLKRDLFMVHLLRIACASRGPLAAADLMGITSELYNIGIFSEWMRDCATEPSSQFNKIFEHVFQQHMVSSRMSQFWKLASDMTGQSTSLPRSRYLNDFEELQSLGHGGFGHVVLCKNKLDGRQYAVKKIRLKDKSPHVNERILREVATLSRLQHQHVVRYYQAWFEEGIVDCHGDSTWGSRTAGVYSSSFKGASTVDGAGPDNKSESTYLYIQMEYCPRTLRQVFDSYRFDKELAWHLFRQIVEGLAHIHGQGIIHRDLTPSNIFFDARNDIKIGDFGLAKFLKFEQLDQDPGFSTETAGASFDGTGQVGTYFYTAPEIEQGWPKIDEKVDMYSLGVVFFELWHPFGTAMERHVVLSDLKHKAEPPLAWADEFSEQASLLSRLMSPSPSDRPSATELLQHAFPPRMEYELLDNFLRTMHTSEDTSIYDKIVSAVFDEELSSTKGRHQLDERLARNDMSLIQCIDLDIELRDHVADVARDVFRQHCAKHLEIAPMRLLDGSLQFNRDIVKLLTRGGDMIELCQELRLPFANWIVKNQKSSLKRYEITYVYRRSVGHSPPNRYLQGDLDIVGGASAVTEAEVIRVAMDIMSHFFNSDLCDIRLNHGHLLDAIWSWVGIKAEQRQKVAELLSTLSSLRPQSSERKLKWVLVRRQLQQEMNLAEAVVNRLQTVGLRFCGPADQALPRLRGALPADKPTRNALDELSELISYLRVWRIEKHASVDALMMPTESYHRDLFFQIYLMKDNYSGAPTEGALLAIGGRYDYMLHQIWDNEYKSKPPGAVGISLALETIIQHSSVDLKPFRNEASSSVLVCSRGGGGLLEDRMELVSELWEKNIKAEIVPLSEPSLTGQYEYANEHDIKILLIITDTGLSQTGFVKVRHLELKREKEVKREDIVKFLSEAMATQFRNSAIWN